jgi:phosphatidylserine/phosphatidylglycerophosphate/cardiolipin synthase-like enzyme
MHAKCVVVDEAAAFITSANFTAAAQQRNVEVGVLVRDVDFATRVAAQWRTLAARGMFRPLASSVFAD